MKVNVERFKIKGNILLVKGNIKAKSGVGGIMAIAPNRMGIGIYSPALDKKGNSTAGIKALELLSENLELSIFLIKQEVP